MTDIAIDKPTKIICDGCGKRITESQASISSGSVEEGRQHWHLTCWPYRLKTIEPQERLAQ
jgi:hypothetical protein